MKIQIVAYGIAKDILGNSKYNMEVKSNIQVGDLLVQLKKEFPRFNELNSLLMAVNDEYADHSYPIKEHDEVVLIPPVSGG